MLTESSASPSNEARHYANDDDGYEELPLSDEEEEQPAVSAPPETLSSVRLRFATSIKFLCLEPASLAENAARRVSVLGQIHTGHSGDVIQIPAKDFVRPP